MIIFAFLERAAVALVVSVLRQERDARTSVQIQFTRRTVTVTLIPTTTKRNQLVKMDTGVLQTVNKMLTVTEKTRGSWKTEKLMGLTTGPLAISREQMLTKGNAASMPIAQILCLVRGGLVLSLLAGIQHVPWWNLVAKLNAMNLNIVATKAVRVS